MRSSFFSAAIAALMLASPALAHSHLESSVPAANAMLDEAPDEVALTFETPLRAKESSISLLDVQKHAVSDVSESTVSKDQKTLSAKLPALDAGVYTVKWKAVCMCADHHLTKGSYQFTVK